MHFYSKIIEIIKKFIEISQKIHGMERKPILGKIDKF